MRLLVLLFLCSFLAIFAADDVENGFFHGRSGDIIVGPIEDPDNSFLLLNNNPEQYNAPEIEDVAVADLISHFVSFIPLNAQTDRRPFPQTNIFTKPKASLVFAVDGVGGSTLDSFESLKVLQKSEKIKIKPTFGPYNTISLLTTLISGSAPSQHGIIANKWMEQGSKIIQAFENSVSQPLVANFPSILSQSSEGQSLVMSFSSNPQFAAALGTHYALFAQQPDWHNYIYHATEDLQYLEGTTPSTIAEIATFLSLAKKFVPNFSSLKSDSINVEFDPATSVVTVTFDSKTARFSLQEKADLTLFFELELVHRVSSRLEKNNFFKELTQDNFADYFAFSFAGLKTILDKYGKNSPQFNAAVRLLDQELSKFMDSFNALYEGKIVSQTILLAPQQSISRLSNEALALIRATVHEAAVSLLPHIYLGPHFSSQQIEEICNALKSVIPQVYCNLVATALLPSNRTITHFPRSLEDEVPLYAGYQATYTEDDLANFHIILWLGITLVIALFLMSYGIAGMNSGKDSLLYRSSHSQSRHHHQA
jgi:hypothetical protein